MNQHDAPILTALRRLNARPVTGFGGPAHHLGRGASRDVVRLLGRQVFEADVLTPKGLDDRAESGGVMQQAYALAAEAWGGDLCRFSTGGSTQSVQTALSAFAAPGDVVLMAQNCHWAEFHTAVFAGIDARVVPVAVDGESGIEHGMEPATLLAAIAAHPEAKAIVVVSPTVYGATSDIAALAEIAHAHRIPLIVDAAWGAAFPFSRHLPEAATASGADVMVCSLHKTLGALAQGSIMVVRGDLVDKQRFAMVFEMYQSTSPSVPILASIDATRRDHAVRGARLWRRTVARANYARARLARIDGITVYGRELVGRFGIHDVDETKVTIDVKRLGLTGFQADEWLQRERRVSVVLSDLDSIVASFGTGTTARDVRRLVAAVQDLAKHARDGNAQFFRPATPPPGYDGLSFEQAMPAPQAFYGETEDIAIADAAGRLAAEVVAPAPPATPRLLPGQRITAAHVAFLEAHLACGTFLPDPSAHGTGMIRVVRTAAS